MLLLRLPLIPEVVKTAAIGLTLSYTVQLRQVQSNSSEWREMRVYSHLFPVDFPNGKREPGLLEKVEQLLQGTKEVFPTL